MAVHRRGARKDKVWLSAFSSSNHVVRLAIGIPRFPDASSVTVHMTPPRLRSRQSVVGGRTSGVSYKVILDLISATTTETGLKVICELDDRPYPKGIVVSDEELAAVNIVRAVFHGEWNYTIKPSNRSDGAVDS